MLRNNGRFLNADGKRTILLVDDEQNSRELLGHILKTEYEVLFAENGRQGLDIIREKKGLLSLVLLDLLMPVMSGAEMLWHMKQDPDMDQLPVIVLTSDQSAEIKMLDLGAIDFIPKPFPQADVILARIRRTIELCEGRNIIQSTERDPLTGLYNRDYFYRYAEQFDQYHPGLDMDAITVDIYHFRLINERFGTAYGDRILRQVGQNILGAVRKAGGIMCRQEADNFLIYCPHLAQYDAILQDAVSSLNEENSRENRVLLRMGVYPSVDKTIDIERRFDRAKTAADTVRSSVTKTIAIYDNALHEKELYEAQLVEDFHTALAEEQFKVYYQPKYNVQSDVPMLTSAEALVRWEHPRLGMISPAVFIPLFEENGQIQELDLYVWEHAAEQIRDWRDRFGFVVPVSVNVSRIDMYESRLVDNLRGILEKNGLQPADMMLEITESAYTQNSQQIIQTVNRLRGMGFKIEMDDFGTGYSSLNMISTLPIDALKLDMQFIRNAFSGQKNTRMLEVIIDIADYLNVPVIAEGVETEEQLQALRAMGCDIVQGYYFSKPIPPVEYEQFMIERMRRDSYLGESDLAFRHRASFKTTQNDRITRIVHALTSSFENIYYVDTETNRYVEFGSEGRFEDLQIECTGDDFFEETQRNLVHVVYPEDQTRVSLALQKETLLSQLIGSQPFSLVYRLMIGGAPVYYHLKVVKAVNQDGHHIVVGVSSVEEEIRRSKCAEPGAALNALNFDSLAMALTMDMESIYYVNLKTGAYMEFICDGDYGKLKMDNFGKDFFADCRRNIEAVIYPDDRKKVAALMQKDILADALQSRSAVSLDYRLMIDGRPLDYRMKIARPMENDGDHIVIGVSNINPLIPEPSPDGERPTK